MRRATAILTLAGALTLPAAAAAQDAGPELSRDQIAEIDRLFSHFGNATPGAALAVVRDGEIVHEAGYGMSNLEYDIPITPASTFHVASISKQFAAMSVVLLALEGRVDLDGSIRDYIPEVPDFGHTITVRHLLNHTSGMRDQWNLLGMAGWRGQDTKTQDDILDLVTRQRDLNFEPGSEYLYSNTGFTLMAILVERVTGQPMKEFADERIFQPLGMTDTHFHDDIGHIVRGRTYAYNPSGGGYRINIPDFANYGATSLFTNVRDLAKWANNFEHRTVGGDAGIEMLMTQGVLNNGETIPYALGFVAGGEYRGLRRIGHSGSDAGYRADFAIFPDQRTAIIVLSNVSNGDPGGLSRQVADIVLADAFPPAPERPDSGPQQGGGGGGQPPAPPPELSTAQMQEYTGIYHSPELGVDYEIATREGELVVRRRKFADRTMTFRGDDLFQAGDRYQFTRDTQGRIDGFEVTTGRIRNLRFERRD